MRASPQARHAQRLARNQDIQQGMALRQGDATGLADTGHLRLFFFIEHHCQRQPLLLPRHLLAQCRVCGPQTSHFLLRLGTFDDGRNLLGFAVHPLPAHALLLGEPAYIAVPTTVHEIRAANPSAEGYHAHG